MDKSAHTPQSLMSPVGCHTCAALATVSMSSATGKPTSVPGAMRSVLNAVSHVRGHWGELPSSVGKSKGSTVSRTFGAKRWWAVQCRTTCSGERSRYPSCKPPS